MSWDEELSALEQEGHRVCDSEADAYIAKIDNWLEKIWNSVPSKVFWAANKRFEVSKFEFKFPRARKLLHFGN